MEFPCIGTKEGKLSFGPVIRARVTTYLQNHGPIRMMLTPVLVESNKMRRWYEGGLVRLICYYQEGMDHNNPDHRLKVREWLKLEFNSEIVEINGKTQRIAKSTKGRATFNPFVERVQDWFVENYDPPQQAMDPERFKEWRDTVYSFEGGPSNYIDYLKSIGILK